MTHKETMQQALSNLESVSEYINKYSIPSHQLDLDEIDTTAEALRDAIAVPEPTPLFWYRQRSDGGYEGPLPDAQIEMVRKLSREWRPLFAAPVKPAEPVKYLASGMRFKTSEFPYGVCINGLPKELAGRWVALVAAEDDCHLKAAPVKPV